MNHMRLRTLNTRLADAIHINHLHAHSKFYGLTLFIKLYLVMMVLVGFFTVLEACNTLRLHTEQYCVLADLRTTPISRQLREPAPTALRTHRKMHLAKVNRGL